jgi:hypothetical protein
MTMKTNPRPGEINRPKATKLYEESDNKVSDTNNHGAATRSWHTRSGDRSPRSKPALREYFSREIRISFGKCGLRGKTRCFWCLHFPAFLVVHVSSSGTGRCSLHQGGKVSRWVCIALQSAVMIGKPRPRSAFSVPPVVMLARCRIATYKSQRVADSEQRDASSQNPLAWDQHRTLCW